VTDAKTQVEFGYELLDKTYWLRGKRNFVAQKMGNHINALFLLGKSLQYSIIAKSNPQEMVIELE